MTLKKQPKISVIGAGYVGLCTAVGFASKGYSVLACDVDEEKIAKINKGIPPFHEPGLQEKLSESIQKGNLKGVVGQTDKVSFGNGFNVCCCGNSQQTRRQH